MAPSYGHSSNGVNIANYRLLTQKKENQQFGYRTPYEWREETKGHLGMGVAENNLSSTLRQTSSILQTVAAEQVVADMSSVEEALKAKLKHTEQLKVALQHHLGEVQNEIELCVVLRTTLEERLNKVQAKLDLNNQRLGVRNARPGREKTMDDVEKTLLNQQGLMNTFIEKVKRAVGHVDREVSQLEAVKAKLQADLADKVEAIQVDTAVLNIPMDGGLGEAANLKKKHDCLLKTPHTWVRNTEDNVNAARHWVADSARLRKAVRHAIHNSRMAEHDLARSLNSAMLTKLNATANLKDDLEKQLARIRDEQARAEAQRTSLAHALEAKRGPLQQAKDRLMTRSARPCREFVQDDVEAALAKEIAHLNAVTSQLSNKVSNVDKELAQLDLAAAMIEDNIRDKSAALSLDEQVVLMDGRINIPNAPPSSVASYQSNLSTARTATLRRIQDLENALLTARREREMLESNVAHLKATMGANTNGVLPVLSQTAGNMNHLSSPTGPLSPSTRRLFTP
mmetsp:Transcript_14636/g.31883  ORF Transcript_14636/g.31883 Transcript_14636/m.31883 type:complete len:512 (+) Transcript_14636:54-1589(+)|eukprot:CAMPEP_0202901102 /NCGR_PEP_ID=MMETSP1392-20130828/13256_1 /ASSEMBLY_ACC=CAM_ASM_000868 /TAXON_ID=225041 /ORGANISM="Chlamydomonas chlamydogama, Strain SAG 11-48b" /LENGTH=511 /DNA_ID=CAMNT_0049587601 /DNA_START=51 /DNA_END=1586 /DNA_ORIENTATION=-